MASRALLTTCLLIGGVAVAPSAAQAGWSEYTSNISEVDACNQAQYLMPEQAVPQQYVLKVKDGNFRCKVRWSDKAGAEPSNLPVLLPAKIGQPIFAGGWL